jgi:hypothetical protein
MIITFLEIFAIAWGAVTVGLSLALVVCLIRDERGRRRIRRQIDQEWRMMNSSPAPLAAPPSPRVTGQDSARTSVK